MVLIEEVPDEEQDELVPSRTTMGVAKEDVQKGGGRHAMHGDPRAQSTGNDGAGCSGEGGPGKTPLGAQSTSKASSPGNGKSPDEPADAVNESDSDDDELPPLENMSVRSTQPGISEREARGATNNAQQKQQKQQEGTSSRPIKRGFFDAKPKTRRRPPSKAPTSAESGSPAEVPTIRAKASSGVGEKSIPSFLRVDPSESEVALGKMKEKLVEEMKPTPDMINSIQGDSNLMDGFDDPEVMAAVAEVARDASSISKYQNNPKVMRFYRSMAGMMAERFNKKADEEERGSHGS